MALIFNLLIKDLAESRWDNHGWKKYEGSRDLAVEELHHQ
jgi:hypothetical protein